MERIYKTLRKISESNCDCMLVTKPENVSYLSNFTGDSSHLFMAKNRFVLLTDGRYLEQARQECFKDIEIMDWIDRKRYDPLSYQYLIDQSGVHSVAFESNSLSYDDFTKLDKGLTGVSLIPIQGLIETLRTVKDEMEVGFLREACKISDKALQNILPDIKPGLSERELTARLEYELRIEGADDISFTTIVLSGKKTSLLHGHPGDKELQNGEFLLFDFGALFRGYHSDISRTFVIGKASRKQKYLFSIIEEAQRRAVECIQDGVDGDLPDRIVRQHIPEELIKYYYPGMGHGVGLEIHEEPFIRQDACFTFRNGMVLTVEPGIYIPEWGGLRIEDTLLVTVDGTELLTRFPRELREIG